MRLLVLIPLLSLLSGCFFAAWKTGGDSESGNTCLPANAYVGQRILNKTDGALGTVRKIYGASERCRESTSYPFLADVDYSSTK